MNLTRFAAAATLVAALGLGSGTSSAQVINDFDSDLESWRFDFGAGGSIAHDPTEGSPGNASGAARLTFDSPVTALRLQATCFFPRRILPARLPYVLTSKLIPHCLRWTHSGITDSCSLYRARQTATPGATNPA